MNLPVPHSLLLYETLFIRGNLSPTELQQYEQIKRGYYGERKLASILRTGEFHYIIPLFDKRFVSQSAELQIDCLILTESDIFLLEVKNYTGDYHIENNNLFSLRTKTQIYNPLTQIERTEFLFKRMLRNFNIHHKVHSYVIFTNDDFTLYGATPKLPIILPSQIQSFLNKINENAPRLTKKTKEFAHRLINQQIEQSAYEQFPHYTIDKLNYGLFCDTCLSKLTRNGRQSFLCSRCQYSQTFEHVILFAIAQFHLLFPDEKLTTEKITNWCGNIVSKKAVRRVLHKHFDIFPNSKYTYYAYKSQNRHLAYLAKKYTGTHS